MSRLQAALVREHHAMSTIPASTCAAPAALAGHKHPPLDHWWAPKRPPLDHWRAHKHPPLDHWVCCREDMASRQACKHVLPTRQTLQTYNYPIPPHPAQPSPTVLRWQACDSLHLDGSSRCGKQRKGARGGQCALALRGRLLQRQDHRAHCLCDCCCALERKGRGEARGSGALALRGGLLQRRRRCPRCLRKCCCAPEPRLAAAVPPWVLSLLQVRRRLYRSRTAPRCICEICMFCIAAAELGRWAGRLRKAVHLAGEAVLLR